MQPRKHTGTPPLRLVTDADVTSGTGRTAGEELTDADLFTVAYAGAAQLDALRERARELNIQREPLSFSGFGALLDELLPLDDDLAEQIARAVRLTPGELIHLRSGIADPLTLSPLGVARLGDAAALTWAQLQELVLRDHVHLGPSGGETPGECASWSAPALAALRATWLSVVNEVPGTGG